MKPKPIPTLDPETLDEIDKIVKTEDKELLQEPKASSNRIEIHTVDLDTIIKFEAEAKVQRKENEENGRGITGERNGNGKRKTAVSERTRKSGFIY